MWIKINQSLSTHKKIFAAADALTVEPVTMVGALVCLWLWAVDNAPAGDLSGVTTRSLSRAAQWPGDPDKFADTLIAVGLLDKTPDGHLTIHDWGDHAGALIDGRNAEKERSRQRRAAEKTAGRPPDSFRSTAGRPPDDQKTTAGQNSVDRRTTEKKPPVDKIRKDNNNILPPTPSFEGEGAVEKDVEDERFSKFWAAYPKKTAKQYALKAWKRAKVNNELFEKIMQALDEQKRSEQWRRDNGRYIPNPATWINGGYWDNVTSQEVTSDGEPRQYNDGNGVGKDWTQGFQPADDDLGGDE